MRVVVAAVLIAAQQPLLGLAAQAVVAQAVLEAPLKAFRPRLAQPTQAAEAAAGLVLLVLAEMGQTAALA